MGQPKGNLIEGVDNETLYSSIREKLEPLFDPSLRNSDREEELLNSLNSSCDQILTPFRRFLETELPQYDYKYNDVVGFEEGKWSAEVNLMLHEGIYFTGIDIELLKELGRPIWVLAIELSLILPVYLLTIEKWELSKTRENWIDCTPANNKVDTFSTIVSKIKNYLDTTGFHSLSKESLGVEFSREITGAKGIVGKEPPKFTLVQLLFNELFDSDIDILAFSNHA